MMHKVVKKLIADSGRTDGWSVRASTNRRELLPGTTYAVCCVEVSGLACVKFDNDIPLKYGLDQCIGDTIGPGGLFKGLRTIPVFLDILRDIRELAPGMHHAELHQSHEHDGAVGRTGRARSAGGGALPQRARHQPSAGRLCRRALSRKWNGNAPA